MTLGEEPGGPLENNPTHINITMELKRVMHRVANEARHHFHSEH